MNLTKKAPPNDETISLYRGSANFKKPNVITRKLVNEIAI